MSHRSPPHPGVCAGARRGEPYTPDQCRLCWLCHNDPAYVNLGVGTEFSTQKRSLPCIFLGAVMDRLDCPCPARWIRSCELHGSCTLNECKTCADYEAE